ncbi:peptidase inhibitor family I36 protein [Streptomyces clavuligerus]|uniref:Peptidase inhibitor family I36 n=1 Tax=Streptomyces clavuligerus TaxID=1901 RepID=B5GLW6_STRCL|nr:hypothetical protein [Streptomyces clavuligerus]EDY47312.1 hypothetical protein SSCG_00340 [Streptomyces clavuligerus]EFG04974.1 Hypothetical protein SCLAV_p1492 [Streptomyces clavuligerus]MBY6306600.1 hypothetical protein [Streptomyces clavuligerus]QCS10794.1 hypothetical protein CRV15_35360 [Streptomyces clavuligerus]QPJ97171.1 hypothetical protein GE265_29125 [Streptomyces clavuligerus]
MTAFSAPFRRPGLALAALVSAVAAVLTVPAAPAAAATSNPPGVHILGDSGDAPPCPTGWLCVFNADTYRSVAWAALPGTEIPDTSELSTTYGYRLYGALSAVNNTSLDYCAYPQVNYGGTQTRIAAGGRIPTTRDALYSFRPC